MSDELTREEKMEELLRSARCIANRGGEGTAWARFDASVRDLGVSQYTARVYKLQPDDDVYAQTFGRHVRRGADLISQERTRQVVKEGYTPAQDALYQDDELPKAAACYLTPQWVRAEMAEEANSGGVDPLWPFPADAWKPGDGTTQGRVRELVKAGALIAAEIDRLLGEG